MGKFSNLTLLQGLELVLTSDEYPEGRDIVQTLEQLIADNQIVKEGKVATIISERTSEKEQVSEESVVQTVSSEAHVEHVTHTESNVAVRPAAVQAECSAAPGMSSEMFALINRFEKLPVRYHRLFEQLLTSWEKQSGTADGAHPPENH